MEELPLISIIIATYNRPKLLKYAILSALNQTYRNIEVIVIGDCCSESTQAMINQFSDERLIYYNLKMNCGEQSGPNNEGMSRAQGEYFAFLNHDDLYFSDHINTLYDTLTKKKADLAFSIYNSRLPKGSKLIKNMMTTNVFDNQEGYPASTWLFKRGVYLSIGGWENFRNTFDQPSQQWLRRVNRKGLEIVSSNLLSVISFPSGKRVKSYITDYSYEQNYFWGRIKMDGVQLRVDLLTEQLLYYNLLFRNPKRSMYQSFKSYFKRGLPLIGIDGRLLFMMLVARKKGGVIDTLRKKRGLEKKK